MKRFLWIAAAAVAVVVALGWALKARSASTEVKVSYTYAKPERRDLVQKVTINGTITPVLSTEIRSEVSGRIARVLVQAGQAVKGGEPLVELDQSTLRVQLDDARLGVDSAELRVKRTELDYNRQRQLAEKAFVNDKEFRDAEIEFQLAKKNLDSQRARVRLLENSLAKTTIVAPYEGRVLSLVARPGMVVTGADAGREGVTLMEVADLNQLRVEATINEIDVASLAVGQPVEVTFESVPEAKATGRVSFVSPAAKSLSTNSNAPKEFPLQVAIESAHPRVKPGMTARVHIETARAEKALSVDAAVIFHDFEKDESFVFVRASGNEPERRVVKLGVRGEQHVEITSGVSETDEVSRERPPSARAAEAAKAKKA